MVSLAALVTILIVAFVYSPSTNFASCTRERRFRDSRFEGVVFKKYIDDKQHSTPTIAILGVDSDTTMMFIIDEHSGIYDKLNIGDTLKKLAGSLEIEKIGSGSFSTIGPAIFQCDTILFKSEEEAPFKFLRNIDSK